MSFQNVGYIRVSAEDQNEHRQLEGVDIDEKFIDKISGKSTDRPALQQCLTHCRRGDILHVHSIDRFARSLHDLESLVRDFNAKGVTVTFLTEKLSFSGDLEDPMATLTLQMLGAFAQFERTLIRKRQMEGIRSAKKRGVRFGRKPTLTDEVKLQIIEGYKNRCPVTDMSKKYGISRTTIYKVLRLNEKLG
ncbi:TPA: recombinase family protein [Vibrio vulnificus]|uniref:recombinase family protein n=1 Tax=Vibrio parahaemolyticus TaxID=670 RepID=UPI00193F15B3|nr:recombinase family protein [Vibrio parahaemolyticus]MBM4843582.1 recombinase family protein [Vibrio parahaemolyticus]WCY99804.1 recombinase family protein [Vibrio parahaemolyticus]HDY7678734.1 recombinase family protein [Vibrio vulnificus]